MPYVPPFFILFPHVVAPASQAYNSPHLISKGGQWLAESFWKSMASLFLRIRQFGIRIRLEKFQLPTLFNAHWQCLGLILEETVCCQCRTEIHKEVMYRAMA